MRFSKEECTKGEWYWIEGMRTYGKGSVVIRDCGESVGCATSFEYSQFPVLCMPTQLEEEARTEWSGGQD